MTPLVMATPVEPITLTRDRTTAGATRLVLRPRTSTERRWTRVAVATLSPPPRKSLEPWIYDTVQYYPHQVEGIRLLANRTSFLLADDMGLGKSLQALTVFAIDVVRGWAQTAIVVAPVTLKGNWSDEIVKFSSFPHIVLGVKENPDNPMKPKILMPAARRQQLEEFSKIEGPKILVVNYEQVVAHIKELNLMRFDVAIYDEAHYMKNPKSKRTKASLSLVTKRNFLLTGSPMLNHVNDLWALLHKIDPYAYPKYWSFVNRYCVFGGYKDKQIIGAKNEKELTDRLQSVMLRRLKKDVLNLKEPQIIERRVDLSPQQIELYNEVVNDMRLPRVGEENPDDIENALTKFLRLKQICGTTLPFTGEDHSTKLDLAITDSMELIGNGHKLVVFTQFRDVQQAYVNRLLAEGHDPAKIYQLHGDIPMPERQGIVKAWGAHEGSKDHPEEGASVIVCMLQVAGIGLNMTQSRH